MIEAVSGGAYNGALADIRTAFGPSPSGPGPFVFLLNVELRPAALAETSTACGKLGGGRALPPCCEIFHLFGLTIAAAPHRRCRELGQQAGSFLLPSWLMEGF
jgi:hypothetical protein